MNRNQLEGIMKCKPDRSFSAPVNTHQPLSAMDRRFLWGLKLFLIILNILTFLIFLNLNAANRYVDEISRITSGFRDETNKLIKLRNALKNHDKLEIQRIGVHTDSGAKMAGNSNKMAGNSNRKQSSSEGFKILSSHGMEKDVVTRRPRMCKGCFEHKYNYLIDNPNICSDHVTNVSVVIMIFTTHHKRAQRKALRETWLTYAKNNTGNIRYAFLLGNNKNDSENLLLKQENDQHGDIIQEDFVDSYRNLTVKTIMAFKWASTRCTSAKYFLKADDDVYINIPGVMKKIRNHGNILQNRVGGVCKRKTKPVRDPNSKWYISYEMYPEKEIPEFCSGTAYMTSMKVARDIYRISRDIPYVNLEDVYISLCVRELGYKFIDIFGFNAMRTPYKYCIFKTPRFVSAHSYSPTEMREIWNTKCSPRK